MFKRIFMVFLTLLMAVGGALLAAKHPTGPNTVSYDNLAGLWASIGIIAALFLPPLILSIFRNRVARIAFIVYQTFVAISFLGIIPIGFISPNNTGVSIIAALGAVVTIISIVATVKTNTNSKIKY